MARYIDVEKAEYPYMSMSMFGINSKDCRIYNEGVKATEDMIQALPTADVEVVRHGEWKHECLECSVCKRNISEIYDADSYMSYGIEDSLKYCPFCGAKMDGGKDE